MNIGFDAKRAFLNQSGLGNYARTLLGSLCRYFPDNHYNLFTTKRGDSPFASFAAQQKQFSIEEPKSFVDKKLRARWRSYGITDELIRLQCSIYHGLSNELPFNIHKFKGKKVVTIHDLIFLRHPHLYPFLDRKIYNRKFRYSCDNADVIVAVSEQTKRDISELYFIPESKIRVIYQSCNHVFYSTDAADDAAVMARYKLPKDYILYVGTIEERKNLLTVIKALERVPGAHLVAIGRKRAHYKKVAEHIAARKLTGRVTFLEDISTNELPSVYRQAKVFVYPSIIEGFGIPVLEALTCGVPVITTKGSCFPEAGGPGSVYIDPLNAEEMAAQLQKILGSGDLRREMSSAGIAYAAGFRPENTSAAMMKLYSEL